MFSRTSLRVEFVEHDHDISQSCHRVALLSASCGGSAIEAGRLFTHFNGRFFEIVKLVGQISFGKPMLGPSAAWLSASG